MKCAAALKTLLPQVRKNKDDRRLVRRYTELTAATGGWEKALKAFAAVGGTLGETAQSELDGTATSAALADFWWNYKPLEADAADAIRDRAAFHYRAALDANELDGLALTLAEQRLAQSDPPPAASQSAASPKVEYKFNYRLDNNGNAILCQPSRGVPCVSPKPEGVMVLPDNIDGHKVVAIDGDSFDGCDKMKKLILPKTLEQIPHNGTFPRYCSSLEDISISSANPNFSSYAGALYTKDRKTMIAYPKARNEIRIPPEAKEITWWAFTTHPFETLRIPEGITEIQGYMFSYTKELQVIEFPKTLKKIGPVIFDAAPNVKKVIFNGDAPECTWQGNRNLFFRAPGDIIVEVKRGSKGWAGPGRTDLPERWPLNGDSRPIRYIK